MVKDLESKTFNFSILLLGALIDIIADIWSTQVIISTRDQMSDRLIIAPSDVFGS